MGIDRRTLRDELAARGIPEDLYSFDIEFPNEAYCLRYGGRGTWEVYYGERGRKSGRETFGTEEDACAYLLRRLLDEQGRRIGPQGPAARDRQAPDVP